MPNHHCPRWFFFFSFRQGALIKTTPKLWSCINKLGRQWVTFLMSCHCRVLFALLASWPGQLLLLHGWSIAFLLCCLPTFAFLLWTVFVPKQYFTSPPAGSWEQEKIWELIPSSMISHRTLHLQLPWDPILPSVWPKSSKCTSVDNTGYHQYSWRVISVCTLQVCSDFPAPYQMQLEFSLLIFLLQLQLTWPCSHDTRVTTMVEHPVLTLLSFSKAEARG